MEILHVPSDGNDKLGRPEIHISEKQCEFGSHSKSGASRSGMVKMIWSRNNPWAEGTVGAGGVAPSAPPVAPAAPPVAGAALGLEAVVARLEAENARLKEENARLKGELAAARS